MWRRVAELWRRRRRLDTVLMAEQRAAFLHSRRPLTFLTLTWLSSSLALCTGRSASEHLALSAEERIEGRAEIGDHRQLPPVHKYSGIGRPRGRNTPGGEPAGAEMGGSCALQVHSCGRICGPGGGNAAWRWGGKSPQLLVLLRAKSGAPLATVHEKRDFGPKSCR